MSNVPFEKYCIPLLLEILNRFLLENDKLAIGFKVTDEEIRAFAMDVLMDRLQYDITAFAKGDPAAKRAADPSKYIIESYKGLKALMYYRLANKLLDTDNNILYASKANCINEDSDLVEEYEDTDVFSDTDIQQRFDVSDYFRLLARQISEEAAIQTKIEINPSAKIGYGFVIDHGVDTRISPAENLEFYSCVIGETCEIGDNCTVLNGVYIGSNTTGSSGGIETIDNSAITTGVILGANGPQSTLGYSEKRHPTIGNNVTICAGVRIFGNISIGNNVFVAPGCVITESIPSNYSVTIINQLQYQRISKDNDVANQKNSIEPAKIYALLRDESNNLVLFGENLLECSLDVTSITNGYEGDVGYIRIITTSMRKDRIELSLEILNVDKTASIYNNDKEKIQYSLKIFIGESMFLMLNPPALNKAISKIFTTQLSSGGTL